ncbi:MAG: sodium/proline symporter PutP [Treponema sp.]|nr:sodium/proline symporter PutP [Treponema sp.]
MTGVILVFGIYTAFMIAIGVFFFKKSDTLMDYFIGGRQLNAWVAAFSTHASDMSGWLMMGLVGSVYAFGIGQIWIALGLALGTILNWLLVAKRIRRYSLTAGYAITLPEFFENRFHDSSHILRFVSAVFITIFFTIYAASGFVACGSLFSQIFGIDYQIALLIAVLVILIYTFLGGFRAVCWTDFFQGLLMLITILAVPLVTLALIGGPAALLQKLPKSLLNPAADSGGRPMTAVSVISQLAWGLGYFGMPHLLIRFMAVKREKEISRAALLAGSVVIVSLAAAILMGLAGAALIPQTDYPERTLILTVQKLFTLPGAVFYMPVLGGVFFCGVFAAIMSTIDSQLLVTASTITSDLYQGIIHREAPEKHFLLFSRFSIVVTSIVAYLIAVDPDSSVMDLVSNAWSGFGSAFSALILCSLYWKRLNRSGAAAGIVAGGLTVIIWDHILCVPYRDAWLTLGQATGLYSLAPGFIVSLLSILAVSLITKPPSQEIYSEFERAAVKPIFEE